MKNNDDNLQKVHTNKNVNDEEIEKFNNTHFHKRDGAFYRNMFDIFATCMEKPINPLFVNFIKQRSNKDLIFLQLKCTKNMHEPDRALTFLGSEINRRLQSTAIKIAIILGLVSFIITIIPYIEKIVKMFLN